MAVRLSADWVFTEGRYGFSGYGIEQTKEQKKAGQYIRLVSISSLIDLIATLLIDYLSAIEEDGKANLAYMIRYLVQIPLTLLLNRFFPMDAPWYAVIITSAVCPITRWPM